MPIKVSCRCGQSFMAKDELIGQTLLCPKCHKPITIEAGLQKKQQHGSGGGMADLLDEAGIEEIEGSRCPKCLASLRPNAVLCVACGFNLQTGEETKGAKVRMAGQRGHGGAADMLLEKAAIRIAADKAEERKTRKQGLPAWVYFLALSGLSGFAITMLMIPKNQAFLISGLILIGIASLASTYYQIRVLIVVFSESVLCGVLYLFLPFYPLYYLITRWDDVGGYFLIQLGCGVVAMVGGIMLAIAPLMVPSEENARSGFHPASQRVPQYAAAVAATDSETWTV
ncbi:MAG: hypothetical protein ACC628_05595 [Pirellulaceae bacterium]